MSKENIKTEILNENDAEEIKKKKRREYINNFNKNSYDVVIVRFSSTNKEEKRLCERMKEKGKNFGSVNSYIKSLIIKDLEKDDN